MPWPDWKGPSIPTDWDDIPSALVWFAGTSAVYYSLYRWELLRTLARMPNHAKTNPSLRALLREAARRTNYLTFSRSVGVVAGFNPAVTAFVTVPFVAAGGYVATHDQHAGATGMLVGDMNMGMPVSSELYSRGTSSNPAGWDLRSWWDDLF